MTKIEAVIRPFKLEEVKAALHDLDCEEVTITEVFHGGPAIERNIYRGCEYRADVRKVKLDIVVAAHRVEEVLNALSGAARTNLPGNDGTVLVYEVAEAIRIRNGRRAELSFS